MTVKFQTRFSSIASALFNSSKKILPHICVYGLIAAVPVSAATLLLTQERFVDSARGVAVADFDADGDADIVVTSFKDNSSVVFLANEMGVLFPYNGGSPLPAAVEVATGDIDGDGILDLVVDPEVGPDRVLIGDGEGGFNLDVNYLFNYTIEFETTGIEIADFNGDGRNDIAFSNLKGANAIWLSDSEGGFTMLSFGNSASFALKSGDLDADGDIDLVVGNIRNSTFTNGENTVWLNDGSGNFSLAGTFGGSRTLDVQLADLDKDSDLDILATNDYYGTEVGNLTVWTNNGQGGFSSSGTTILSGPSMFESTVADVDQDGDMDIYVSCIGSYKNRLLLNDGVGNYTTKYPGMMDDVNSQNAIFANINGDEYPDLVATESVGYVRVAINQPQAPLIAGSVHESGKELEAFSYAPIKAHPHDVLAFTATNIPPWASFNTETGEISGTPSIGDAGTYNDIIISATDGARTTTLLPLTIQIATNQEIPVTTLMAHYPMRGNLDDIKYENHGYSFGATPAEDQKGQGNEAFSFDGEDDHQIIKHGGPLSFTQGTWNIWVKTEKESDLGIIIESSEATETSNDYAYGFGAGIMSISGSYNNTWCGGEGADYFLISLHSVVGNHQFMCSPNGSLVIGKWQMLTLTINSLDAKLYIDGNLVVSKTALEPIRVGTNYWFGMRALDTRHPYPHYFKGKIAEFMVYATPLTDAEIQQLYVATK